MRKHNKWKLLPINPAGASLLLAASFAIVLPSFQVLAMPSLLLLPPTSSESSTEPTAGPSDEVLSQPLDYQAFEDEAQKLNSQDLAVLLTRPPISTDLMDDPYLQTICLQAATRDRESYLAVLTSMVKDKRMQDFALRLLYEGASYLDAFTVFHTMDAAASNPGMVSRLRQMVLHGIKERPEQFAAAIGEASIRDEWAFALAIWNRGSRPMRTPELSRALIELAAARNAKVDIRRIINISRAYESDPLLSVQAKRFATAYLKATTIAESLFASFQARLNEQAQEVAALARTGMVLDLAAAMRKVLLDQENPFFLQYHADLLAAHLRYKITAAPANELSQFSPETVVGQAWQWINYFKRAGIPPGMRTHH